MTDCLKQQFSDNPLVCNPTTKLFEQLQKNEENLYFCVDPLTGHRLSGYKNSADHLHNCEVVTENTHGKCQYKKYLSDIGNGDFSLKCNGEYFAKQQCNSKVNICWCVNELTGEVLENLSACPFSKKETNDCCGEVLEPTTEEPLSSCKSQNTLQCDLNGNYIKLQESTMGFFCVDTETGVKTSGTVFDPHELKSCEIPKKLCLRDNFLLDSTSVGVFRPSCDENGNYSPQQCHSGTGYCWCVQDIESGLQITATLEKAEEFSRDCSVLVNTDPENGPCKVAFRQALKDKAAMKRKVNIPKCDGRGFFAKLQNWNDGVQCVDYVTGVIEFEASPLNGYSCDEEYNPIAGRTIVEAGNFGEIPPVVPKPSMKAPINSTLCEKKGFEDRQKMEQGFMDIAPLKCDENGKFQQLQYDPLRGDYCVDVDTGKFVMVSF